MHAKSSGFIGLVLAFGLSGCGESGTFLDDAGTLVGEKSKAELTAEAARQEAIENKVPVQSVRSVEVGRTRNGWLVTAFGTAPGLGYALPTLRPRRSGRPAVDGFIEYDFVATVPAPGLDLPPGSTRARALRADLAVEQDDLQGARGIRVIAAQGGVQVGFN